MKITKKLIVMGLLLALAGVTVSVRAEQETPTPPPTPAPETPAPTPAPETPAPTPAPETPAPTTPAPTTPAPTTPAPTTPAPTTPAPETPAPGTPAPETPAPKSTKPVEQQLSGRVVALDNTTKSITIQVNNQTYVLKTIEGTKFTKAGKTKSFEDLIVGEEVTVTVALQETASGQIQIAVVAVDSPSEQAQGIKAKGNAYGYGIPPFANNPNLGNVGGNVRSPSN